MDVSQELLNFISEHRHENIADLNLKFANKNIGFSLSFAITQIEARRRASSKIPSFIENPQFIFPSLIASEQASNEAVARYHASLIGPNSRVLDLTAGLGIDDMSMAMAGALVTACEIDYDKCEALKHNLALFDMQGSMTVECKDSIDFLQTSPLSYDVIFADPARRSVSGKRTHALADCTPDILNAMPLIMAKTDRLLVKASPMLDLTEIKKTVENLYSIHVVCFRGECKELLLDIRNYTTTNIHHSSLNKSSLYAGTAVVDLDWHSPISNFIIPSSSSSNSSLDTIPPSSLNNFTLIYEPNAGIMKTGAWDALLSSFPDLVKADPNTHLFLSDTLYKDFPGKIFRILSQPDKKTLKALKGTKINVATRNYPLAAPQLEKKLGVKSGGDNQLFAFRLSSIPVICITSPVRGDRFIPQG